MNHAPDAYGHYLTRQVLFREGMLPGVTQMARTVIKPQQVSPSLFFGPVIIKILVGKEYLQENGGDIVFKCLSTYFKI